LLFNGGPVIRAADFPADATLSLFAIPVRRRDDNHSVEGGIVQYALLIYDANENWAGLSDDDQKAIFGEYFAINEAPGIFGGSQLQPVESATTVRVANGETLLTDGPFVEAKEFLGGYYLFEADDLDAATAIAARIPAARMGGAVEVRPMVER
jgi:hypothetical protein